MRPNGYENLTNTSYYTKFLASTDSGNILSSINIIVSIIVGIGTILFIIWWDLRNKQRERFEEFKTTFLPFIEILKQKELPHGPESIDPLNALFASQAVAMLKIKDRLKGKRLTTFTAKWGEYKKEQENFETYILAVVTLESERIYKNDKLLNLINEILEIAKHN
jgi:hypothetical protein